MKLYLVRHAKPLVEAGICYGASDVPCSEAAMNVAAMELLKTWPKTLTKGLPIVSSPLSRCERLSQILCWLDPDFVYKTDARLAEMNFGAWEMQPWAKIATDELSAWTDAFASYCCGGSGESCGQFIQRVARCLYASLSCGEDQIWITHAGVIRALQWLGLQRFELFTALVSPTDPAPDLGPLRAADWPAGEVAYLQVQCWNWPAQWPSSLPPPRPAALEQSLC
jgi:alpha-ribazole phosphatase